MTLEGEFYRYHAGTLVPSAEFLDEVKLAAADSWLVENGRVRNLSAHFERFNNWVLEQVPQFRLELKAFERAVTQILPTQGRWFPRIELHLEADDQAALYLRIRKAPEQLGPLVLFTYPEPDPRSNPTVKGPDLSLCMQLRRHAQMHHADETVFLDQSGHLVEGALTSIVWIKENVLYAPNHETKWLESITRKEIFDIAKQSNLETKEVNAKPQDLNNAEIWALSSLQGIRPVINWIDESQQQVIEVAAPKHFEAFNKRLKMLAAPIGVN